MNKFKKKEYDMVNETPFGKKEAVMKALELKRMLNNYDFVRGLSSQFDELIKLLMEKEVIELPRFIINYLPSNQQYQEESLRITMNRVINDNRNASCWMALPENQLKFAKAFSGEYEVVEEKEEVYIIQVESKEFEGLYSYLENYEYTTVNQINKEINSVWKRYKRSAVVFKDKEEAECIAALIRLETTENITVEKYRK